MVSASAMQNPSLITLSSTAWTAGFRMWELGVPLSGNPMRAPSKTTGNLSWAPAKESRKPSLPASMGRLGNSSRMATTSSSLSD
jgi:hypothetical protein